MQFIIQRKLKSHEIPLNLVEIASSMWDKARKARDKTAYAIIQHDEQEICLTVSRDFWAKWKKRRNTLHVVKPGMAAELFNPKSIYAPNGIWKEYSIVVIQHNLHNNFCQIDRKLYWTVGCQS